MIFMWATGRLVDMQSSFRLAFLVAGILPLLGYTVFTLLARQIKPLAGPGPARG